MSTSIGHDVTNQTGVDSRILQEGYGPGAWHGPDLESALADVTPALALWRPAPGRHNIAEICAPPRILRTVGSDAAVGRPPEPFVLEGEDCFDVSDERRITWTSIQATVASEQERMRAMVADIEAGRTNLAMKRDERLRLVIGITCHAVYHAGQIQLIKRLHGSE